MTTKYIEIDRAIETALLLLEEGEDEQTLAYNAALVAFIKNIENVPAADVVPSAQPEIIRCKDCKHWRQQTTYQGAPLSFGFCESDDMWRSLYGETYEVSHIDTVDDFYCGYAERRTDGSD